MTSYFKEWFRLSKNLIAIYYSNALLALAFEILEPLHSIESTVSLPSLSKGNFQDCWKVQIY